MDRSSIALRILTMSQNSKDFSRRYRTPGPAKTSAGKVLRNVLIWSYDRGTLQYDLICALILAFIFSVPRSCFISKTGSSNAQSQTSLSSFPTGGTASSPSRKTGN